MDIQTFFNYNVTSIIFSVVFGLGVISGMAVIFGMHRIKRNTDNKNNLLPYDNPEWHSPSDVPCPGSLIACVDGRNKLYFGYAVALHDAHALLQIPSFLTDYKEQHAHIIPETVTPIPIMMFEKWIYIEKRILPVETLRTYAQMYKG